MSSWFDGCCDGGGGSNSIQLFVLSNYGELPTLCNAVYWTSNAVTQLSNDTYPAIVTMSDFALQQTGSNSDFASGITYSCNAAVWSSNEKLNRSEYDSSGIEFGSNLASALQETVDDVLGPAITGLTGQVADVTASLASTAAQLVTTTATTVTLGTALAAAQSSADAAGAKAAHACNVAYDISQQVASVVEPKAAWASNQSSSAIATAVWGSNAVSNLGASFADLSATAQFGSNTAADALGLAVQSSNLAGAASNQAGQLRTWLTESNYVTASEFAASSNAAGIFGSNAGGFASNALSSYLPSSTFSTWSNAVSSNLTVIETDIEELLTQLDVTFDVVDSNTAFASNAGVYASNQVVPLATAAAFGSNAGAFGSNLAVVASNQAFSASGGSSGPEGSFASNLSVATSNDLYPQSAWASNAAQQASVVAVWTSNMLPSLATEAELAVVSDLAAAASNQAFSGGGGGGGTATVSVPWWGSNVDPAVDVADDVIESGDIVQRTRRVRTGAYLDERPGFASNLVLYPPTSNTTVSSVQIRNPGLDQVVAEFRADGTTTLSNLVVLGNAPFVAPVGVRTLTGPPNNVTEVTFSNLTANTYMLVFDQWVMSSSRPSARFSSNNGATWYTTGYLSGVNTVAFNSTAQTNGNVTDQVLMSAQNAEVYSGNVFFYGINTSSLITPITVCGDCIFNIGNASYSRCFVTAGVQSSITNVNAIQLRLWGGQTFNRGRFKLYAL